MKDVKKGMMALYKSAFTPTNARNPFYYEMLRKLSSQPLTSSITVRRTNYFVDDAFLMFSVVSSEQIKDNALGPPDLMTSKSPKSAVPPASDRPTGIGPNDWRFQFSPRNWTKLTDPS